MNQELKAKIRSLVEQVNDKNALQKALEVLEAAQKTQSVSYQGNSRPEVVISGGWKAGN